jgi:hypothetical protein
METNTREKILFIEFLKEKEIKEIFENNFEVNHGYRLDFNRDINFTYFAKPMDYIISGFGWDRTDQGYEFWEMINLEWKHKLKKLYKENEINF